MRGHGNTDRVELEDDIYSLLIRKLHQVLQKKTKKNTNRIIGQGRKFYLFIFTIRARKVIFSEVSVLLFKEREGRGGSSATWPPPPRQPDPPPTDRQGDQYPPDRGIPMDRVAYHPHAPASSGLAG